MWARYINEKSVDIYSERPSGSQEGVYSYVEVEPAKYNSGVVYRIEGDTIFCESETSGLNIEAIKNKLINEVNSKAYSLLEGTDWKVVKWLETGGDEPPADISYRAEVRAKAGTIKDRIRAFSTKSDLEGFDLNDETWPLDPNKVGVDSATKV